MLGLNWEIYIRFKLVFWCLVIFEDEVKGSFIVEIKSMCEYLIVSFVMIIYVDENVFKFDIFSLCKYKNS